MNKGQVVWLIIRFAGAYFAYRGLIAAANLLGNLMLAGKMSESSQQDAFPVLLVSFVQVAFYVVAAIYLIGDGSLLFDLLNREEPPNKTEEDLAESGLNLNE